MSEVPLPSPEDARHPRGSFELTDDELRAWDAFFRRHPGWKKRWDLVAAYAHQRGGLALEFWKLRYGPAFGERKWWSVERCAEHLGVPVSELMQVWRETSQWVQPRLEADPEWQKLQRADKRQLYEELKRNPPRLS